jgi:hypothetical protein
MFLLVVGCASGPALRTTPNLAPSSAPLTLESIAGGYGLVAIDGRSLPTAPAVRGGATGAPAWPVVASSLTLRSDGVFLVETSYETNAEGAQRSFAFSGTCFSAGSDFRMIWEGGGQTALSVRADTVVVNNEGTLFSYVRR